jgi:hypothetical protein
MWVFTTGGFISVVQDRDDPKLLVVRARTREHMRAFLDGCGLHKVSITHYPEADYAFRSWVSHRTFAEWLAAQAEAIDYENFKDACKARGAARTYLDALLVIWRACYKLTGSTRFVADDDDVRVVHDPRKKGGRR